MINCIFLNAWVVRIRFIFTEKSRILLCSIFYSNFYKIINGDGFISQNDDNKVIIFKKMSYLNIKFILRVKSRFSQFY